MAHIVLQLFPLFLHCMFLFGLMLYTRLALPVAVCIVKRGRNTRLAWIANPNPNPNPTNPNPDPNPKP